ncbi:MAG: hypothetical protein JW705_08085 [Methanosarcinaceae archaeon]|nr:hypothetical protein [Methanosarcinaceae archaeon]
MSTGLRSVAIKKQEYCSPDPFHNPESQKDSCGQDKHRERKVFIQETDENVAMFTGPSAYYAAHEMEHLENTEIEGLPT